MSDYGPQSREHGITAADGSVIGVGDVIVTRQNQRDLGAAAGWVKNGDQWIVVAVDTHRGVTARRESGGGVAQLPGAYARDHVELGYATTAHRAQGRTVDMTHAFVTATTMREPLYVMATRGRESNMLYVDTAYDPDVPTAHERPTAMDPSLVLEQVLTRSSADISATEMRERERDNSINPARLEAEGAAVLAVHQRRRANVAARDSATREL